MPWGDWRLKFGKIEPHSVWNHGNEFRPMLPAGVELFVVNLGVETFEAEDYAGALERLEEAARTLDDKGVDCIVAGGAPAYAAEGAASEDRVVEQLRADLAAPFTTSMLAQVDALRAVGAESVLVVTPFPQASNEERRRYLEDRGFEVAAIGGVERSGPSSIGGFPSGIIHRLARTLAAEVDGGFDAINVANPQWEAANYIEAIEGDLGCPVVTSSQAQVWKAFELGGIAPQVDGYGVLFDHL